MFGLPGATDLDCGFGGIGLVLCHRLGLMVACARIWLVFVSRRLAIRQRGSRRLPLLRLAPASSFGSRFLAWLPLLFGCRGLLFGVENPL
jgi:hypothetical protein